MRIPNDLTIDQLIELLENAKEIAPQGGDTVVRVAYQQSYPLAGAIAAVSVAEPFDEDGGDAELDMAPTSHDSKLWIGVGSMPYGENPYAPGWAWNNAAGM